MTGLIMTCCSLSKKEENNMKHKTKGFGFRRLFIRTGLICCLVFGPVMRFPGSLALAQHGHGGGQNPVHDIGEVVVTAGKIDVFIEQNPAQVVFMDAAEIEARNILEVAEALAVMPGVDVKQSGSGLGTRVSVRGGGGSGSVLVLIDGRPASAMQYGGVDLSSIPIDMIKKITVFKPPVPVWLGPGSAAGAIYIETREKKRRVTHEKSGKVRVSGGSYGLASGSATAKFDAEKNQVMVSGGYSHRDGKRTNSQKDQGHLSLGYDRKDNGRELSVNARAFVSDHGVAGPLYNLTPNARQRYEKASAEAKYKGFTRDMDYTLKTWGDYTDLDETADNGSDSRLKTLSGGAGTDLFFVNDAGDMELRVGTMAEYIQVDHSLTGDHDRSLLSANAQTHIRTQPFVYTLGARAEHANDFQFSPGAHAGVSYALSTDTVLKTSAGYSENIPSFGQLYQPSHGSVDQVRGNPDLDEEKIVSLTAGGEHRLGGKHTLGLTAFHTRTRDLIKYRRDVNGVNEPFNVDSAYKQGIEAVLEYVVSPDTGIDLSYVFQDTENKDTGKQLSYSPAHAIKLVVKTVLPTRTRLEWITRAQSEQYSDDKNTEAEKLDQYITCDVKLNHPVTWFNRDVLLSADIHNLFDESYASHFGYPDDGFRLELGLSMSF
jgi:iron complex outermembrane receptor protein